MQNLGAIQPKYIAAGAIAVMVACFALFACLAFIWTVSRSAEGDRIATEVAAAGQTRQATRTPRATTSVTATANPLATRTPFGQPTSLPIGGSTQIVPTIDSSAPRPAPHDAVRNYYTWVGEKRYDLTWPLLSDTFKQKFNCCTPNYDFAGYMQWWESVDHVEFGRVETVSQTGDRATVFVELIYVMKAGTRSDDGQSYIDLVYDGATGQWLFDDKRAA